MSRPPPPPTSRLWKFWNAFTRGHVAVYRLTGGKVGSTFRGCPTLLLTHMGRKSGRPRTNPLFYLEDGQDLVLVASKGGSPKHPAWFVNLRVNPTATVQVGREKRTVTARLATAEERARLWPKLVEMYSEYDTYQRHTAREIPVVILSGAQSLEESEGS